MAASPLFISILPAEMKLLPDSPPPSAIPSFRSSLRSRSLSCEIESCAESSRAVDSSTPCEAYCDRNDDALSPRIASQSSGYGYGKGFYAAKLRFCSPHRLEALHSNQDDDYDEMQWANAKEPLQTALQSSGYGDGKGSYAEQLESYRRRQIKAGKDEKDDDAHGMQRVNITKPLQTVLGTSGYGDGKSSGAVNVASGKENKVRYLCKPVSIAMQQHSGPIKPNSGPFSGPLKPVAKPNSVAKPNRIIPVNLLRKKLLGSNVCEPVSPKVTCLGRVKINEIHSKDVRMTTDDKLGHAVEQKAEKGKCFDTKNQLCGSKGKGRKKKKVADKTRCLSRKRNFALKGVTESKSCASSETVQTRREKAASLASSLSGLLEDVRRLQKGDTHYVPSVPPPNSLLLMRGGRRLTFSPRRHNRDEATIDNDCVQECAESSTLVEDVPSASDIKKLRNSTSPHFSLLDLIDMEKNSIQEDSAPSEMEDHTMTVQGIPAIVHISSLLVEKESCTTVEDNQMMNNKGSLSPPPPPAAKLWQRRSIAELHGIEVRQCAKVNAQLRVMR